MVREYALHEMDVKNSGAIFCREVTGIWRQLTTVKIDWCVEWGLSEV